MGDRSITLVGFPANYNKAKLKIFMKKITGDDSVESLKEDKDGKVTFTFTEYDGVQRFLDANVTEFKFGMNRYKIEIVDRPAPRPRAEQPEEPEPEPEVVAQKVVLTPIDETLQESLYKQVHNWNSLPELGIPRGTKCALVQEISPTASLQKIFMHFESKKRADGGPLACVAKMIDGLLVIFQNDEDCQSCIQKTDQTFNEVPINIFPKLIPACYERKFVIENVGETTTKDTLVLFLENCSVSEATPRECTKQDIPGMYLVDYGPNFDLEEKPSLLKKLRSKRLEGQSLTATSLLRTDCLKLTDVKDSVTNDKIKLMMESKKRTNGGPVTRIDRTKQQSVLVYFALIADAERVHENAMKSKGVIIIDQHPIHVSLYHHSLSKDHEEVIEYVKPIVKQEEDKKKKKRLEAFQANPDCDQKVLLFVAKTDNQRANVQNEFKKLAQVEFVLEQDRRIAVRFTPQKVHFDLSQKEFEDKCVEEFEKLINDQYSVVEKSYSRSTLDEARSHRMFKEIEETYTGDDIVAVSWKPRQPSVTIIGLSGAVRHIAQLIETSIYSKAVTKPLPEDQYNVVVHCGVLEQMRQKSKSLHVKLDHRNFTITMFGPENEVLTAQLELLSSAMSFDKRKLTGIDEVVLEFLSNSMQKSGDLFTQIQERFKADKVRATIWCDDETPYIRARSNDDFKKAIAVIKNTVIIKSSALDKPRSDAFELPEWKEFEKNIQGNGQFGITIKPNQEVLVVGMKSDAENVRKQIESYLHENSMQRFFLCMKYGKAKFVVERSKEFSKEKCEELNLKCGMTAEAGGGIYLEGKNAALKKAHDKLLKLKKSILELPFTINKPGMKEFYHGDEGKSFLITMERANDCTILVDTPECEEWVRLNKERITLRRNSSEASNSSVSSLDPQGEKRIEVTLPGSSVKLSVWKTDIGYHRCEVIVNASNEDMLLLPSGISGVIKKFDDNNLGQIQDEMKKIASKHYGRVDPGEAYITSAGNLPFCKSIVHAVGPRWHSSGNEKRMDSLILKACISKTLEVTDEEMRKSIAIPAVSCGVFGGKVNVCIPLIVEAVEEFFKENKKSSIKEVHFVEFSQPHVLDEFVNSLKKYEVETPKPPPVTPLSKKTPSKKAPSFSPSILSNLVQIIQGDITQQRAHVIVNATDPGHINKIAEGPVIGKLLAKSAGQSVIQQCANLRGPFTLGSVHETNGGGLPCKQIYHALVTHYDPNNSPNVIKAVISNCLTKADAAGHSSIVFPAIATGGFQHPPDLIAKIMNQEFTKFKGTSLKEIIILLYPGNQQVIDAFDKEFKGSSKAPDQTGQDSESESESEDSLYAFEEYEEKKEKKGAQGFSSNFKKIDDMSGSVGSVVMSICEGDITQMSGDFIVNSTNPDFRLNQGMVSTKILQIGGQQIQTEANRNKKPGADFVVTKSGNLPCKEIIHLVTPTNPEEIHKKIIILLKEVERRKKKSVYMPAFGTGMLQFEVDTIASIMRASIEEFAKTCNPRYLEFVSIVIFNKKILKKFQDGFLHPEKKQGIWGRLVDGFKGLFYSDATASTVKELMPHEQPQNENVLQLFFYAATEENINKAIGDIQNDTDKRTLRQIIQDDTIDRLSDWERYEIKEIVSRCNVKLSQKKSRYLKELVLEGMTKDVMRAKEDVKDVIREFNGAETCAQYVIWQLKVQSGSWEDLPLRSNNDIEKAFKSWHKGKTTQHVVNIRRFVDGKVVSEQVDLKDTESSTTDPKIRRKIREKTADDQPSFWDDMQGQKVLMVALVQGSQEYQNVLQKFQSKGTFHQSIKSIERVQHLTLYQQYAAKKVEITDKLKSLGKPIEQQLFHGTADSDKIIQHGFDRSYAGKNATVYGRGVYFAVGANYSHTYAQPNSQNERSMFLADVITGEFCQGNQSILYPPAKSNSRLKNDIYDSVVDNMNNPSIYVIFKDASAYPAYLITYT